MGESSTAAPASAVLTEVSPALEGTPAGTDGIKVYNPVESSSTPTVEPDEGFFEPTLSDVQSHHAAIAARNKRLNEAPLLTSKHREAEKAEREKAKKSKWPNTTIRIKFSDGTIIQNVFPSTSPIQPVYAFVRSALHHDASEKPFILWQPPRTKYPERPTLQAAKKPTPSYGKTSIIPPANYGPVRGAALQGLQGGTGGNESLYELGLVPQSVLVVKWDEEALNATGYPAPIREELKAHAEPLPASVPRDPAVIGTATSGATANAAGAPAEKKIPKWLQKGLLKKKT
ncbi:hypothetical protein IAU60_004468 [Kwoniella sp. DSM 27419]